MSYLSLISILLGNEYFEFKLNDFSSDYHSYTNNIKLIAIMSQFQYEIEDNPTTTGRGHFLSDNVNNYINYLETEISRCDGFKVDRPPHDSLYFKKQLEAVANYYHNVSHAALNLETNLILNSSSTEGYYTVSETMENYAKSDNDLARFFKESIQLASQDISDYLSNDNWDEIIFIVFHAGLSQDFSVPYIDPTVYDLKSAYIDESMWGEIDPPFILNHEINTGILLPETQNMIYFDVVEDVFGSSTTQELCDIQMGLTGTFAFLLGYGLGLTPMFNTDNGNSGVGYFGLMDHGSNNGRGVIPAVPVPWTRIRENWSSVEVLDGQDILDSTIYQIASIDIQNKIYKLEISENEYFLIENRNNWINENIDIDSLRIKNKINNEQLGYWFDTVVEELSSDQIQIDEETHVIMGFDNYDYGLPGSGILIWHINNNLIVDNELIDLNNNPNNRFCHLEEGDGVVDIGFENYAFFASDNPTLGTRWDFWYSGNQGYNFSNPSLDKIIFNNWSIPNSRLSDGSESFISININSEISNIMDIYISYNDIDIFYISNENIEYLGNSYNQSLAKVYYQLHDSIFSISSDNQLELLDLQYIPENVIYSYQNKIEYVHADTCINDLCENNNFDYPMGYIESVNDSDTVVDALSLGDVDQDGLDEIITIEGGNLLVKNNNGTILNGFPVPGDFFGIPLIANIVNDEKPEIIIREGTDVKKIVIISNKGHRIREFSSMNYLQNLVLIPNWNEKIALLDGKRILLFDQDLDRSYWLNPRSRASGMPVSTGVHKLDNNYPFSNRVKAFNYPNPVLDGKTTFRFFNNSNSSSVQVKIYNASGFLIEILEKEYLTPNDYNEISWVSRDVESGLYFAEIHQSSSENSEIIQLLLIK